MYTRSTEQADKVHSHGPVMGYKWKDRCKLGCIYATLTFMTSMSFFRFFASSSRTLSILKHPYLGLKFHPMKEKMIHVFGVRKPCNINVKYTAPVSKWPQKFWGILPNPGHSQVFKSAGQHVRRCGRREVSCRLVLRHFHYVTPPTHFSGFLYFHYVTPPTFLCRNEDFFNFVVIYFNEYFNSNLDMYISFPYVPLQEFIFLS